MARVVILYESANGLTRECALRLAEEMNRIPTVLIDLGHQTPELQADDLLIVGSPVRHGKLMKKTRLFLKQMENHAGDHRIGIFLCCGFADRFEEYRDRLIPKAIRERAFCILNFGGRLNPAGKPFWDKLWLFHARSQVVESEIEDGEYTPVLPGMIPENIGQMASFAKKELSRLSNAGKRHSAQ